MSWRRPDAGASTTPSAFAPANGAEEDAAMEEEVFDDSAQTDGDVHDDQNLHDVEDTHDGYEGPADEPPTVLKNKGFWSSKEGNDLWEQLKAAREAERARAIADGLMDDPVVPKRLEDAITMVGTCMDMCPRFERYTREHGNQVDPLEAVPGSDISTLVKPIDHRRAVKKYERGSGDKIIPSDLRPPPVLKRTLDYLFHTVLTVHGFGEAHAFVRDRSRAVRNDFVIQRVEDATAVECYERCARFHILAFHLEPKGTRPGAPAFDPPLELEQLMKTLTSLKEYYEDMRENYASPAEFEMRIYHRLVNIRDEKPYSVPDAIAAHPVYELTSKFRTRVQQVTRAGSSGLMRKHTAVRVDAGALAIFGELVGHLRSEGNRVMIFLIACILEHHFGKGTIEDMDGIRGGLSNVDIIDGVTGEDAAADVVENEDVEEGTVNGDTEQYQAQGEEDFMADIDVVDEEEPENESTDSTPAIVAPQPVAAISNVFGGGSAFTSAFPSSAPSPSPFGSASAFAPSAPVQASAFANLGTTPSPFGTQSAFGGGSVFGGTPTTVFDTLSSASATPVASAASVASSTTTAAAIEPAKAPATAFTFGPPPTQAPPARNPAAQTFAPTSGIGSSLFASSTTAGSSSTPAPSAASADLAAATNASEQALHPIVIPSRKASTSSRRSSTSSPLTIDTSDVGTRPKPKLGSVPSFHVSSPTPISGLATPAQPAAPKWDPVSLPGTPTVAPPPRMNPPLGPVPTLLNFPKSAHSFADGGGILSPLAPPSPSMSRFPAAFPSAAPSVLPSPALGTASAQDPFNFLGMSPLRRNTSHLGVFNTSPTRADKGKARAPELVPTPACAPAFSSGVASVSALAAPPPAARPDKGKQRALSPTFNRDDAKRAAHAFERRGELVRRCFGEWMQRVTDRAARRADYEDALHRSEAYAERVRQESPRKRQPAVSVPTLVPAAREPPRRRERKRKRPSAEYRPPQSDAELATRLKENHAEHEARWAPGSFLAALRARVAPDSAQAPPGWQLWLSTNPISDGTAIWLERKLDVPHSGSWVSDGVFAIAAGTQDEETLTSPGLLFFECSPLEGLDDELERKYRILDDCARLREVFQSLPDERRYVPSILFVVWGEAEQTTLPEDMEKMARDWKGEGLLAEFGSFVVSTSTKDVDGKFRETLASLEIDIEGGRTTAYSLEGILSSFTKLYAPFIKKWASRCGTGVEVKWSLYGALLQTCLHFAISAAEDTLQMWGITKTLEEVQPIDVSPILDSESAYRSAILWLEQSAFSESAKQLLADLRSQRGKGQVFPFLSFITQILPLVYNLVVQEVGRPPRSKRLIAERHVEDVLDDLRSMLDEAAEELAAVPDVALLNGHADERLNGFASPLKRRAEHGDVSFGSPLALNGMHTFSSPAGAKRQRKEAPSSMPPPPAPVFSILETPERSLTNGINGFGSARTIPESPSPTITASSVPDGEASVTVAMLRALTQSVRKKFADGSL